MAKKTKKKTKRVAWSKAHDKDLRGHSKSKTAVTKISKLMKRTVGALRQLHRHVAEAWDPPRPPPLNRPRLPV